jgi:hypothetical protein
MAIRDGVPNNRRGLSSLHSYPLPEQALQRGNGASKDGIAVLKINKVSHKHCLAATV